MELIATLQLSKVPLNRMKRKLHRHFLTALGSHLTDLTDLTGRLHCLWPETSQSVFRSLRLILRRSAECVHYYHHKVTSVLKIFGRKEIKLGGSGVEGSKQYLWPCFLRKKIRIIERGKCKRKTTLPAVRLYQAQQLSRRGINNHEPSFWPWHRIYPTNLFVIHSIFHTTSLFAIHSMHFISWGAMNKDERFTRYRSYKTRIRRDRQKDG